MAVASFQLRTVTGSFFDRGIVTRAMSKQEKTVLSKFGAYVRQRAKSSIRKAKQKAMSDLTPDELLTYKIIAARAKKEGRPRPKRPLASSKPGEPPRSVLGYLKKFLYFAYDAGTKSVVIGPALFGGKGTAPRTLEEGGKAVIYGGKTVTIKPRPYMGPAFRAELPGLPKLWQQARPQFNGGKA